MRKYQLPTGDTHVTGERHHHDDEEERLEGQKSSSLPSHLIDARIAALGDWRGETLARVRTLIKQACPGVVEEWKWRGVPVWEHAGIVCTGEAYKNKVKLTFAKGASLKDPSGLFNASLEGNTRRAIDLHEGGKIDASAFQALFRAAVALNISARAPARPVRSRQKLTSALNISSEGPHRQRR